MCALLLLLRLMMVYPDRTLGKCIDMVHKGLQHAEWVSVRGWYSGGSGTCWAGA